MADGSTEQRSGRAGWQTRPLVAVQIGRGNEEREDERRREREREREEERRREREEERRREREREEERRREREEERRREREEERRREREREREEKRRREEEKRKEREREDDRRRRREEERSRERENHVLTVNQETRSASPVYSTPIKPGRRPPSPVSTYENVDIPSPSPKRKPPRPQPDKIPLDKTRRVVTQDSPTCYENVTIHYVRSHSHSPEPLGQAEGGRSGVGMAVKPQKSSSRHDYENIQILTPAGPIPYPLDTSSSDDDSEAFSGDEAPSPQEIIYENFGFDKGNQLMMAEELEKHLNREQKKGMSAEYLRIKNEPLAHSYTVCK